MAIKLGRVDTYLRLTVSRQEAHGMVNPTEQLVGKTLADDWVVVEAVPRKDTSTGGNFSRGYIVESSTGQRAYLKAIDLRSAFGSPDDVTGTLQQITETFNFERTLCRICRDKRLSRVVRAITDGSVRVDPDNPMSQVPYLIFELAHGDVRNQLDAFDALDTAWALRALHHVATGLKQLHWLGIAHQDLKPSNVLVCRDDIARVADLGRSSLKGTSGPYDDYPIVGDPAYAPPELLYGYRVEDWNTRRLACDNYLLGSMVVFFFARVGMTALLLSHLNEGHHPPLLAGPANDGPQWDGTFEDVLPYVREAFGRAMVEFAGELRPDHRSELRGMVARLCDPDPRLRGDRKQYLLHEYVSRFDRLARKAELGLLGR